MSARSFRSCVGLAGTLVVVPMVACLMVTLHTQLTTAPHLLDTAVRTTLNSIMAPYLLLALLTVISLALIDSLKPTFCIVSCVSAILMVALLITAYNRSDHLSAAACSVSCAQHVTNVSSIRSMRQATSGAYCWFVPSSTKSHKLSRCYVHDPHLVLSFRNGYHLELMGFTFALLLVLGGLAVVSSPPSLASRKDSCAL
ncbi:hypothetical protein E2C01_043143 [Portunus trituberculatus]|uniref:Uncharacterized protein n=1 Tax=Portunus trituberculatus TaxID=210409 RepID=A0A5B7FYK4_PORTR|nr:hypothetical protein [Portunus trituberculatus]